MISHNIKYEISNKLLKNRKHIVLIENDGRETNKIMGKRILTDSKTTRIFPKERNPKNANHTYLR